MENRYKVLQSRPVYANPWFQVSEDKVIHPDGHQGLFGVIEMKPGSSVLAFDEDQQAYVVQEYKYAVQRSSVELVSGGIDDSETPLEAARRELQEEAGLAAREWIGMGVVDPFTTIVASPNYLFLAMDLQPAGAPPQPGEVLKVEKVPFSTLVEMALDGAITHAASCVLILKVERRLRALGVLSA